jgi:hypothetical protein
MKRQTHFSLYPSPCWWRDYQRWNETQGNHRFICISLFFPLACGFYGMEESMFTAHGTICPLS